MPGMGMGGMMFGGGSAALNQLLTEMDPIPRDSWKDKLLRRFGIRRKKAENPPVLTMGATNLAEVLDPALVRPGRFDWKITVDLPSRDGRKELLEYYIAKVNHVPDLPMDRLADITIGYTPVAIKHVINEAAVIAHFDERDAITYNDFREAMGTFEWGIKQPLKSMNAEEKRRIAYHEAGHAVAQAKLLPRERIEKLTIVRHVGAMSGALGFAATKPKEEIYTYTKEELLAHMQVSLASRAAEQIFLGIEMTGASHDLQNATGLAGAVIGYYGMNGTFYSNAAFGQWQPDGQQKREIERLLDQQFHKVRAFLDSNRDILIAIAETLLQKEDLAGEEVYEIIENVEKRRMNGHSGEDVPLPEPAHVEANPL
jgi:ATP-dependent Zn protease